MAGGAGRQLTSKTFKMTGSFADGDLMFWGAKITEGLSKISEARVEFFVTNTAFKSSDILGTRMKIEAYDVGAVSINFVGVVVEVESLGHALGFDRYAVELRSWLWFLTRGAENRVFQKETTPDIIKKVFSKLGFTDLTDRLSASYKPREYCVQYGETNFAFVSRLMEEEGIYYYFDHEGATEKLVLADSVGSHTATGGAQFKPRAEKGRRDPDTVFEWIPKKSVVPGKVSLFEYDMTKPNADLKVSVAIPKGDHAHKNYEMYSPGGKYKTAADGEAAARRIMEATAHDAERVKGSGNAPTIRTGALFDMEHSEAEDEAGKYLVCDSTIYLQEERTDDDPMQDMQAVNPIKYPDDMVLCHTEFEVARDTVPYRPKLETEWPRMDAIYPAIVTGPAGDEIYTDEYGRIKVMFPWDRERDKPETSCWVRVAVPWAGKGYGMFATPRIGQEVFIQFEFGNPDYPICTGMAYNGQNSPPYALPGNMTQSGFRTESTKGGGGFHELIMEDKKGEEYVRMQSEKDYVQIIKNNATITIGLEKADPGDLKQTIEHTKTETINTGDDNLEVKKGNQTIKIKVNQTETIGGDQKLLVKGNQTYTINKKQTHTIKGDQILTVKGKQTETVTKDHKSTFKAKHSSMVTGNKTLLVKSGNLSTVVKGGGEVKKVAKDQATKIAGKQATVVEGDIARKTKANMLEVVKGYRTVKVDGNDSTKADNYYVTAKGGKVRIKAMTEIKLNVGGSSIKITSSAIEIKSTQIKINGTKVAIEGTAMTEVKGAIAKVEASGILTLKGSITKIN